MKEQWKKIPGFEDCGIEVSNLGRVISYRIDKVNGKLRTLTPYKNGGIRIELQKKPKRIQYYLHQLVAMAFLNHVPDGTTKLVVDHIDNNRLNNRLDNLQIVTNRENLSKDKKPKSGCTGVYKIGKKWRSQIRNEKVTEILGTFSTPELASEAYQKRLKEITTKKQ
tara:strand:+ start:2192 stop:2689 length:498 start_codon:yes stop_codon:yes gene_type:complete